MGKQKATLPVSEHQIQTAILEYLQFNNIFCWRNNTGAVISQYKGKTRMFRFGAKGSPDIMAVIEPYGRLLAIEVKRPGKKATPDQSHFLGKLHTAGALTIVATSLEDIIDFLKVINRNKKTYVRPAAIISNTAKKRHTA